MHLLDYNPEWLIESTPIWLVRLVSDGLLAVLYFCPNVLGLILYAWGCFWLVDILLSLLSGGLMRQVSRASMAANWEIGGHFSRLAHWSVRGVAVLLKVAIGLPSFYATNLALSSHPADSDALRELATGYPWQNFALGNLPIQFLPDISNQNSTVGHIVALVLAICVILCIYYYWSAGFAAVRDIRRVGDVLLARIKELTGSQAPRIEDGLAAFARMRWSTRASQSGVWFLAMVNLRLKHNVPEYDTLTPAGYATYKVVWSFGAAVAITFLHPVVAGLYLATLIGNARRAHKTLALHESHFMRLPEDIRIAANNGKS